MSSTKPSSVGRNRWRADVRAGFFGSVVFLTDLLPPRIRYGYAHRITRAVFGRQLPSVPAAVGAGAAPSAPAAPPADARCTCALLADHLDIGGIGSVVEMLARGLPAMGVRPVVICRGDGVRARKLRDAGIQVISVESQADTTAAIKQSNAAVLQLHMVAPAFIEAAAMASELPMVTVMHNTEIHFPQARWRSFTEVMRRSCAGIAVSETVRGFHARHLPDQLSDRIVVIGNGAPAPRSGAVTNRDDARGTLGSALGCQLDDEIVFVCLARYDSQKNIAGMVWSFLQAVDDAPAAVRLVVAGDPSDWAELLRADGLRRSHPHGNRVNLLGNSDAATLLAAADAFILDSFFEGWPVAATEGAAAGLPLLLSEVGGARELIARDPGRSIMVPNPAGSAEGISDEAVRRARRRTKHQANAPQLGAAIRAICETVTSERRSVRQDRASQALAGSSEMVREHSRVLLQAARREPPTGDQPG